MTKLERATVKAIKKWCLENDLGRNESIRLRHIYPRAYVLGKMAGSCIAVACPPVDAEPQIKKLDKIANVDGSASIHLFDKSLRAGDWCSVAYVCFRCSNQQVAIPAVEVI